MSTADTASADDSSILRPLALALVDRPRATLQELAHAVGISKTTLYRFCRTRDELIQRLIAYSTHTLLDAIQSAHLDDGEPVEALRRLITSNLTHPEATLFLMYFWWRADPPEMDVMAEQNWQVTLDSFFLRGQQQGLFRIDMPAAALTEIWSSIVVALVDAERRGRVARVGLEALIENAFLTGTLAQPSQGCQSSQLTQPFQ